MLEQLKAPDCEGSQIDPPKRQSSLDDQEPTNKIIFSDWPLIK